MLKLFGVGPSTLAVGVCAGVFLMLSFDMLHPPASIATFIVMTRSADWTFLLAPLAVGLTVIVLVTLLGRLYAAAPMMRWLGRVQTAAPPSH